MQPQCFSVEWTGGTQLLLFCPSSNGNLRPHSLYLHPTFSLVADFPITQGRSISVVTVLWFAGNVLCSTIRRVKGVKGRQPGSVALFLCLQCQLPDNHGHTCASSLPLHWSQLQLILSIPAATLTKSICSSWPRGVPFKTQFIFSLCWAQQWSAGLLPSLLWSLLSSCFPCSLPLTHL